MQADLYNKFNHWYQQSLNTLMQNVKCILKIHSCKLKVHSQDFQSQPFKVFIGKNLFQIFTFFFLMENASDRLFKIFQVITC